jgi:ABC-type amino acid transport substrate-binding protein
VSDMPLDAHEHLEHAEHAAHANDPFISLVSITIAVLAVAAAVTSSLETFESASAIIAANRAVLLQDQATDQWSLYEAKSVKKNIYSVAADASAARAADYLKKAKAEGADQDVAQADARKLEGAREEQIKASETHEGRHHRLTIGATLLEMGIALSTIAIVTRKRWPWYISATLGAIGAVIAILTYLF